MKNKVNKITVLIKLILIFFLLNKACFTQNIIWENFSVGIQSQLFLPEGDLKTYWGKTISAGFVIDYKLENRFSITGGLNGSSFNSKINSDAYPDFLLLEAFGGLKSFLLNTKSFSSTLSGGIQNNTFAFDDDNENPVESEFGFWLSGGLGVYLFKNINAELFYKYQVILSSPEINIHYTGIRLMWEFN